MKRKKRYSNVAGELLEELYETTHHVILPTTEERLSRAADPSLYPSNMNREEEL